MACNTQLGMHAHNPGAFKRGKGNAWGNNVNNILNERQKRKQGEKSKGGGMSPFSMEMFNFPPPRPQPKRFGASLSGKSKELSFKIIEKPQEKQEQDKKNGEGQIVLKDVVDILGELNKNVQSSGEMPKEVPEGAKVITKATLIIEHEMILSDGTVETYTEKYVSTNEDQH